VDTPLINEIKNYLDGGSLIISTTLENYERHMIASLSYLVNDKKMKGIVLSVNKPCYSISKILDKNKIDKSKVLVIDAISSTQSKKEGNCLFIPKPFDPTNTSIVLSDVFDKEDLKFLIFDTISTLFIYDSMTVVKFIQFILAKFSPKNKIILLFGIDLDTKAEEVKLIAQSCDKLIKL